MLGIKAALFLHDYWQVALFATLPLFLIVNFLGLSKEELENANNQDYRAKWQQFAKFIKSMIYV